MEQDFLVARLKQKDRQAFEFLYDNYSNAIYGVICRLIVDKNVAAEVLQDSFLKYWEQIENYDAKKARLFTWMHKIARNLSIDKLRSAEMKRSGVTDEISESNIKGSDSQNTDSIGVSELMNKLREEEKEIIDLLYLKGYSQREIEKEFGIPLGTVKTRTRMAMVNLRKLMGLG